MIQVISRGGNVDVESTLHINPSAINDVKDVVLFSVLKVWVDLKLKIAALFHVAVLIIVSSHVVISSKIVHVCLCNLDIRIIVPWHNLEIRN